jgi:hypothetical protein
MGLGFKDTFLEQIEGVNKPLSIDELSKRVALAVVGFLLVQSQTRLAAKIKEGGGITNYLPGLLSFGYGKDSQIEEIPTKDKLYLIQLIIANQLNVLQKAVDNAHTALTLQTGYVENYNRIKEMDTHRRTRAKYTSGLTLMTIAAIFVINSIDWDKNWVYFLLSTIVILTIANIAYEYIWRERCADEPYKEINTTEIEDKLKTAANDLELGLNAALVEQLPAEQKEDISAVSTAVKATFLQRYTPVTTEQLNQQSKTVEFEVEKLKNKVEDSALTF